MNASTSPLPRSTIRTSTSCPTFPDNPAYCDIIIGIRSALAAVSLICCVFVIFTIWLFQRYRFFSQRILLYLAVAAACDSFFRLCDLISGDFACRFFALLKTMSLWWIILVILVITVNLLANLYSRHTYDYEWIYMGVCFGFPFFYSLLPLFGQKYGPAGVWCWIVPDTGWRFGIWYGPLFIILPTIAAIYTFIIVKKKSLIERWARTYTPAEEAAKEDLKEEIRTLVVYPFIFIILHIFTVIYRIYDAARPDKPNFPLMLLAAICIATQGAVNATAFFFDKHTRSKMNKDNIRIAWAAHFARKTVARSYSVEDEVSGRSNDIDAGTSDSGGLIQMQPVTIFSISHVPSNSSGITTRTDIGEGETRDVGDSVGLHDPA